MTVVKKISGQSGVAFFDSDPDVFKLLVYAIIVAFAYYLSAIFSLSLSFKPDFIAALWAPNAILLSALFLTPPKYWIVYLLAVIPAELVADLPSGIDWKMAMGFVSADWIEVLAALVIYRAFSTTPPDFSTVKQLTIYILGCSLIAPFIAAFPGAWITGLDHSGPDFAVRWLRWFLGDSLTHLIITPMVILCVSLTFQTLKSQSLLFYSELLILLSLLSFLCFFVLKSTIVDIATYPATILMPMPLLLWASIRFGPRGIFISALIITMVYTWAFSHGYVPINATSISKTVINLQLFLFLTISPLIFLSSLLEERRLASKLLHDSESRYRALFENNQSVILIVNPDTGRIIDANPAACAFYGYRHRELRHLKMTDINTLSEDEIFKEMDNAKTELRNYFIFRHRLADKSIRNVEVYSGPLTINGRTLLCSIVHDITERIIAEQERERLIKELQKTISEVKVLRGFLPICASCKKIRDDDGYWEQIEAYLSKNTDAKFSHSICGDCAAQLYGQEGWYKKPKE